jgi:hypothetical protein
MYGYLKKFATGAIRIRVEQPNLDDLPSQDFERCYSVYGNVKERYFQRIYHGRWE